MISNLSILSLTLIQIYWRKDVHLVLVNRLGSLSWNSVVMLTGHLNMTIVVDWDVKSQIKQTNQQTDYCVFLGVNQQIVFSLKDDDDGVFKIDPRTGLIQLAKQLDRETKASHKITVIAADKVSCLVFSNMDSLKN